MALGWDNLFPTHLRREQMETGSVAALRMVAARNAKCYNCGGRGGLMILMSGVVMCAGISFPSCLRRRGTPQVVRLPADWLPGHHPNTSLPLPPAGGAR